MQWSLAVLATAAVALALPHHDGTAAFAAFVARNGRYYATPAEHDHRRACFEANLRRLAHLKNPVLGVSPFADLCEEEFRARFMARPSSPANLTRLTLAIGDEKPTKIDWRALGKVTKVADQGQCGSPWAFAPVSVMESIWAIDNHPLTQLSVQECLTCAGNPNGCSGGDTNDCYAFVVKNGGIDSAADYPYNPQNGSCDTSKLSHLVARFTKYATLTADETTIALSVQSHGPVSVGVDAATWQFYTGGVYTDTSCGTNIDHVAAVVGFDAESNPPYWIVKNSWGTEWGEDGYIRLEMFKNICGLDQLAQTIYV